MCRYIYISWRAGRACWKATGIWRAGDSEKQMHLHFSGIKEPRVWTGALAVEVSIKFCCYIIADTNAKKIYETFVSCSKTLWSIYENTIHNEKWLIMQVSKKKIEKLSIMMKTPEDQV